MSSGPDDADCTPAGKGPERRYVLLGVLRSAPKVVPMNIDKNGVSAGPAAPITLPAALAEVAFVDGRTAAAAGGECLSKFLGGVRRTERGELEPGEAPYPLPRIRKTRFTRYLMADVRTWLIARAEQGCGAADVQCLIDKTKRASAAAKAKRAASPQITA